MHNIFNVLDFGAKGDGIADDTNSVDLALKALYKNNGETLYFPHGNYLITKSIFIDPENIINIIGDGWNSNILWAFNDNLFVWTEDKLCDEITIKDFKITSTYIKKNPDKAAMLFNSGIRKSYFSHIMIQNDKEIYPGSGIVIKKGMDTTTIHECQFWFITGTGIEIAAGSEFRIYGGRIIGDASRNNGSIGVHLTGDCGGIHIITSDIINLDTGIRIENINGHGKNRELFLTHATLDSCRTGLELFDSSIVSISGCWTASCNFANIHIGPGLDDMTNLIINGGTIFNAGVFLEKVENCGYGLFAESGKFMITGTNIRRNRGIGVYIPDHSTVTESLISCCRINENNKAIDIKLNSCTLNMNI